MSAPSTATTAPTSPLQSFLESQGCAIFTIRNHVGGLSYVYGREDDVRRYFPSSIESSYNPVEVQKLTGACGPLTHISTQAAINAHAVRDLIQKATNGTPLTDQERAIVAGKADAPSSSSSSCSTGSLQLAARFLAEYAAHDAKFAKLAQYTSTDCEVFLQWWNTLPFEELCQLTGIQDLGAFPTGFFVTVTVTMQFGRAHDQARIVRDVILKFGLAK